jgi:DNA methylase
MTTTAVCAEQKASFPVEVTENGITSSAGFFEFDPPRTMQHHFEQFSSCGVNLVTSTAEDNNLALECGVKSGLMVIQIGINRGSFVPNRMPENVIDRYTTDWEPVLLFSKTGKYYFNKEKGRRGMWSINTQGQKDSHYAAFPERLCKVCIEAGCPPDTGVLFDPFMGRGTAGIAALKLARNFIGIDVSSAFVEMARKNLKPFLKQRRLEF